MRRLIPSEEVFGIGFSNGDGMDVDVFCFKLLQPMDQGLSAQCFHFHKDFRLTQHAKRDARLALAIESSISAERLPSDVQPFYLLCSFFAHNFLRCDSKQCGGKLPTVFWSSCLIRARFNLCKGVGTREDHPKTFRWGAGVAWSCNFSWRATASISCDIPRKPFPSTAR